MENQTFSISNAWTIANILLKCGVIEDEDLELITEQLMDGNFQPRKVNEKESKKACKKS